MYLMLITFPCFRLFGAIDDIDVELHIGMSFLDVSMILGQKVMSLQSFRVSYPTLYCHLDFS